MDQLLQFNNVLAIPTYKIRNISRPLDDGIMKYLNMSGCLSDFITRYSANSLVKFNKTIYIGGLES
jgi:hypothetical protein